MPVYEYRCSKCDKVFEKMQKFADEPLTIHEDCGGAVERLISAPGLHFKGSGWYITDYARSGSGQKNRSESKSEGGSESKSDNKSESKSEGKSEGKSESKSEGKSETKSEAKTESKPSSSRD
ncbi:MAG TPA: FmdB family zinc ribbon protein [Bryobacteraceae bacterium]|jgi:putative FmdB family regulatory protein